MTERPILFSAPMVRAILAGTKTQTRRIIKCPAHYQIEEKDDGKPWPWMYDSERDRDHFMPCPYGEPGTRLWVREAFMHEPADYCWEASVSIPCRPASTVYRADFPDSKPGEGWKPSIHMPRNLSRITLEIVDVRVERLQDISEADAIAEGCVARPFPGPWWQGYRRREDGELMHQQVVGDDPPAWMIEPHKMKHAAHLDRSARDDFRSVWMQINGAESWEANPWVWCVSFRRVTP